jgi:hypothetical protein
MGAAVIGGDVRAPHDQAEFVGPASAREATSWRARQASYHLRGTPDRGNSSICPGAGPSSATARRGILDLGLAQIVRFADNKGWRYSKVAWYAANLD